MPVRRRSTLTALAAAVALALAACGQPVDPATRTQAFTFDVANPDDLTGSVFGVVYQAFGTYQPTALDAVARAQETVLRDAMPGATLSAAGTVSGSLMPVAQLSRLNEAIGFAFLGEEIFFVPDNCDVTATNPNEAAFSTVIELVVWDGADLDPNGAPDLATGELTLEVVDGDVTTIHVLVASKSAWSAESDGTCSNGSTDYTLDLNVAVGWQFVRLVIDESGLAPFTTIESRTLDQVADAGVIGTADAFALFGADAPRLTPIYR